MTSTHDYDLLAPIDRLDEVDSTQKHARRAVEAGHCADRGRIFVAARQTGGVGRFGRAWSSPPGGVWATLAWPLGPESARIIDGLGLRCGLAAARAVEKVLADHGRADIVRLKWPNDVLVDGKKIAGVLCEVMHRNGMAYALVGVGVNGNYGASELPGAVAALATTLRDQIGREAHLGRFVQDLRDRLCEALSTHGLPQKWRVEIDERLAGVGEPARIRQADGATRDGVLLGLTPDGRPRLRTADGEWIAPPGAELASG
jgi:BirA family biotin operon repressor/biotin-[acetyl-CoA-carboxylase] ligase